MLTGSDVSAGLAGFLVHPLPARYHSRPFPRIVVDSRQIEPGDLFVALGGTQQDGHRFIADALRRGAGGVLAKGWPQNAPAALWANVPLFQVADPLAALQALAAAWRARFPAQVVGVTGSVGKTSTKEAIAGVLAQGFRVLKSSGNLNTEIGLPLALLELREEHQRAVLEMAMYDRGEIALLCRLARPTVGVVTNIGPTHLERLGSMERIADAKAELVESLPDHGTAVLNADDPRVAALARRTRAQVVTYGLSPEADCRGEEVASCGLAGVRFRLRWQGAGQMVRTPLLGRHSVYTALAAAAVGLVEGLSLAAVAAGLETPTEANRVRVRKTPQGATVLDDTYNASPASMIAALALLREMPGKRVALLGDMLELGSYETEGHREVGRYAAGVVDHLYTVGPRAGLIAQAARQEGLLRVQDFATKEAAARAIKKALGPRVFLLVKGSRGMALEELIEKVAQG